MCSVVLFLVCGGCTQLALNGISNPVGASRLVQKKRNSSTLLRQETATSQTRYTDHARAQQTNVSGSGTELVVGVVVAKQVRAVPQTPVFIGK